MRLTASWMMTAGSLETETPKFSSNEWDENKSSLTELGTVANAAFDMFLDAELTNSTDSVLAGIELMIWIGSVGDPWPLKTKTLGTQKLGDRELWVISRSPLICRYGFWSFANKKSLFCLVLSTMAKISETITSSPGCRMKT
jgi:hypothetical protein